MREFPGAGEISDSFKVLVQVRTANFCSTAETGEHAHLFRTAGGTGRRADYGDPVLKCNHMRFKQRTTVDGTWKPVVSLFRDSAQDLSEVQRHLA